MSIVEGGITPLTAESAALLLRSAREAREHAYAPYSRFQVGAALLDTGGRVHSGVNVENISLGLTICAERGAVSAAVAAGARSFVAIAVAGPHEGVACAPCGACRQVLQEVAPSILVVLDDPGGSRQVPLRDLLPFPFERAPGSRPGEER